MLNDLSIPALAMRRLYRGRADYESRIKELKVDFDFGELCAAGLLDERSWAGRDDTELQAVKSVFDHTVMRQSLGLRARASMRGAMRLKPNPSHS